MVALQMIGIFKGKMKIQVVLYEVQQMRDTS